MGTIGSAAPVGALAYLLLMNFTFDYVLLWSAAEIRRIPCHPRRLALAAGVGTAYFAAWFLDGFRWLSAWPSVVLASALMVLCAFWPRPIRTLLGLLGAVYAVVFLSVGAGVVVASRLGSQAGPNLLAGSLASLSTMVLVAHMGWGAVQKRIWQQLYQVPIEVRFGSERVRVNALVDTGNRLREPVQKWPVVLVEFSALAPILPEPLRLIASRAGPEQMDAVRLLLRAGDPWSTRFRVIPFSSIGTEHGLLVGFRPDELCLVSGGARAALTQVIVAVCPRPLDPEGSYQALIQPELLELAATRVLAGGREREPDLVASGTQGGSAGAPVGAPSTRH